MNKTIKVILKSSEDLKPKEWKTMFQDIRYRTTKASNLAMRMYVNHEFKKLEYYNEHKENLNEKELYGKQYRNVIEGEMKKIMCIENTSNVSSTNQYILKKFNTLKKEILRNEVSIPSFRKDMPIYIHNKNYRINKSIKGYQITFSLFNKIHQKENNVKKVTFLIDKIDKSKKAILERIINEEYKQGVAQITQSKKGKWELNISFGFEVEDIGLDKNRTLGVDIGIKNIIALAVYDANIDKFDYIRYTHNLIEGDELKVFKQKMFKEGYSDSYVSNVIEEINSKKIEKKLAQRDVGIIEGSSLNKYRSKVESKRRSLLVASKVVGDGKIGHGYKKRTQAVKSISDKIVNFKNTFNHKYSRYVVDFAVKNNCGVIQIEDLSGIATLSKEKFLKNWAYYDLQEKIEYKAKEASIKVIKIDPNYTSLRCSECGYIHKDNRESQEKFICKSCEFKVNADINAARNIAIPYIDKIIKESSIENA